MPRLLLTCVVCSLFAFSTSAQLSLTVYSSADPAGFDPQRFIAQQRQGYDPNFAWQVPGFGVVRDEREIDFEQGEDTIQFTDVAAFIDPTTVSLVDLSNRDATAVLEQQFHFDLVSPSKLLDKYLDKEITIMVPDGDELIGINGKLLANSQGQLIIQTGRGVEIVPANDAQLRLGNLPAGLKTKPTLQWLVRSRAAGKRRVRTTYQTDGITWKADYNLVLNANDSAADLAAWVTLMNLSGTTYEDAQLKLIAGDVQRVQPSPMGGGFGGGRAVRAMAMEDAAAFEEKSFYEYHLYTLPRRTTVSQNSTQQIALFPTVSDVKVEKVLVYYGLPQAANWVFPNPMQDRNFGNQSNKKVDVYIRFENRENNKLGVPLPRGKVRVFKQDEADGSLEFIGEDLIDHTPKNQQVLVRTGQAFDVTGERTQVDFQVVGRPPQQITEVFKIELSNAKKEPVKVVVKENLYRWSNWEILNATDEYKKVDSRTIHFEVTVPAEAKKSIEYTVRYSW